MKISVHTPSGTPVEISLTQGPAYFAGAPYIDWSVPTKGHSARAVAVCPLSKPQKGSTYYLDGKPALGLDTKNAQLVIDAIRAYKAQSPIAQQSALRAERKDIGSEIAGALDAMSDARENAFNSDTGSGWAKAKAYEAQAEAARAKLAAFDAAHPEIIAELKAEKNERTARFLAND